MNLAPSKMMLLTAMAAYGWCSWGHLTPTHEKPKPEKKSGKELTAATVNRAIALNLQRDPFDSLPLDRTAVASGVLPAESGRSLGELSLQGVFITLGRRVAVINGKVLHEGEIMESSPGGPMIRAKSIGLDHAIIEGGGGIVLLRLAEARAGSQWQEPREPRGGTGGGGGGIGGGIGGNPHAPRNARGSDGRGIASLRPEER